MQSSDRPFQGWQTDRKLDGMRRLVRAFVSWCPQSTKRFSCTMQLAESTDTRLAVEVLKDIADEERVHAGEFLRLLRELAPR